MSVYRLHINKHLLKRNLSINRITAGLYEPEFVLSWALQGTALHCCICVPTSEWHSCIAVTPVCTAWSSRDTASLPATNPGSNSRITGSETPGTRSTWPGHGGSSSATGGPGQYSPPSSKSFTSNTCRHLVNAKEVPKPGKAKSDSLRFEE